jgi:hypothetical protein
VDSAPAHHTFTHRVAVVRGWLAGGVAFVVTFLVVRWLMRQIWPDQGDPSDVGTDLLRVGTSLAVATTAALAAGLVAYGRRP